MLDGEKWPACIIDLPLKMNIIGEIHTIAIRNESFRSDCEHFRWPENSISQRKRLVIDIYFSFLQTFWVDSA